MIRKFSDISYVENKLQDFAMQLGGKNPEILIKRESEFSENISYFGLAPVHVVGEISPNKFLFAAYEEEEEEETALDIKMLVRRLMEEEGEEEELEEFYTDTNTNNEPQYLLDEELPDYLDEIFLLAAGLYGAADLEKTLRMYREACAFIRTKEMIVIKLTDQACLEIEMD